MASSSNFRDISFSLVPAMSPFLFRKKPQSTSLSPILMSSTSSNLDGKYIHTYIHTYIHAYNVLQYPLCHSCTFVHIYFCVESEANNISEGGSSVLGASVNFINSIVGAGIIGSYKLFE